MEAPKGRKVRRVDVAPQVQVEPEAEDDGLEVEPTDEATGQSQANIESNESQPPTSDATSDQSGETSRTNDSPADQTGRENDGASSSATQVVATPDKRTEMEKRKASSPPMDQNNPKTGKKETSAKAEKASKAKGNKNGGSVTFTLKGNVAP